LFRAAFRAYRDLFQMIDIQNLRFDYGSGNFRLDVPSLRIAEGETVAVVGPSGSGKTTLLNLIAGILLPRSGRISVQGADISLLADTLRRRHRVSRMGLVFQEFELLEYLGVLDNVLVPYRVNGVLKLTTAVRERAQVLIEQVGLIDQLDRFPAQLSQGERQRVAVCRALIAEPGLLLADEPTGNLDPVNKDRVLDILFDYARSAGATLVTVTHDHNLIGRFDRVIDFNSFLTSDAGEAASTAR
jgi:putative ABC transport system ATP-binding protein